MVWTENDLRQLRERGIAVGQADAQLETFKKGFPWLRLKAAASVGNVIMQIGQAEAENYVELWNDPVFRKALRKAMKAKTAVLIECMINEDDKVFPMVAPGKNLEDCFDENDLEK